MNKPAEWKYAWLGIFANKKEALDLWGYLLGFGMISTGLCSLWWDEGKRFRATIEAALKFIEAKDKTPGPQITVWSAVEENRRVFNPKGITGYWKAYYTALSCAYYANMAKYWAEIPEESLPPEERIRPDIDREHASREIFALCETTIEKVFALVPGLERRMKRDALGDTKPRVKAGLHLEGQKFGKKPAGKTSLFDETYSELTEEERREIDTRKIEVIGMDNLTKPQHRALHAIQYLLTKTDYKGNTTALKASDRGFLFEGSLPVLEILPTEFYEAYGLEKHEAERGFQEYSGHERKEALDALFELARTPFIFFYSKKVLPQVGREPRFDVIRRVAPVFLATTFYRDVTPEEEARLRANNAEEVPKKIETIKITASPALVDQHETYFVLKEADYLKELKAHAPKVSTAVYLFIDWLIYQAHMNQRGRRGRTWDWTLSANPDTLKYTLRMDAMIRARQTARIRGIINQAKQTALELKYLESFDDETVKLNPERFYRLFDDSTVKKMIEREEAEEARKAS